MAKIHSKSVTEVATFLFLTAIFFMSCASTTQFGEDEDIHLQESKIFEDFTFGEIWEAALRSVEEIDFIVQKRLVKSGFIFAQRKEDPDSLYLPTHMNIYIRQEYGKISVSCHVVIPGDRTDYEASSVYVDLFFTALDKKLPQLKTL